LELAAPAPHHETPSTHPEDFMPLAQPNEPVAALVQLLAQALTSASRAAPSADAQSFAPRSVDRNDVPLGSVIISGAGLGLPGTRKQLMDPNNVARILSGEQFIDLIPEHTRKLIRDKQVTRLVKAADGSGSFETITDVSAVIKLAGQPGEFNLAEEYGVPAKLIEALDFATQVAMAAGLDALREAGIPLVQTFKRTSKGTDLPDRWLLPEPLRDETGVIFASAFPGYDRFADEFQRYYKWENRRAQLTMLEDLAQYTPDGASLAEVHRRIAALREELGREPYLFDRRFVLRVLAMGHSQFAEYIGARGPNTQVNAACASTTHAISLAEDWIRAGRCRRVLVVSGDDVTSSHLIDWLGASFLALGASATDDRVEDAALPFDRRRHGMILGIGAAALVIESEDAVRERGMRGIVEVLATESANSAFHATRLDADHVSQVMERLLTAAERRFGINRLAIAPQTVFISHETYTPARGGSASAEVTALRATFGPTANDIVVSNTKGLTGHTMGTGVEDVVAVKALEHGIVPPVPNFREVDPDLGVLNLSRGGRYPVQYALRLAAGFGSQIAMTLSRRIPGGLDRVDSKQRYQRWLADVSGYDRVETEVVKRVLRVRADIVPTRAALPSAWQHGTSPTVRAAAPGDISAAAYRPAPMAMIAQALGAGQESGVNGHTEAAYSTVVHSRNGGSAKPTQATREVVPAASAPPRAPAPVAPIPVPDPIAAAPAAPAPALIDPHPTTALR
jgi:3-oxoacyl-(acyl-carrier-protein) synthase